MIEPNIPQIFDHHVERAFGDYDWLARPRQVFKTIETDKITEGGQNRGLLISSVL